MKSLKESKKQNKNQQINLLLKIGHLLNKL